MQLNRLVLKNFRCFGDMTLDVAAPLVLIEGGNGSGKTSLLEAIHYVCYLRSFRTHSPRELINFNQDNFFIKADFSSQALGLVESHELQVGFSGKKRLVKLNQKAVASYKELLDFYRVVTLTEEDMALVQGSPQIRRSFIDQAIMLYDPEFMQLLRNVRHIVDQRTHLLNQHLGSREYDSYLLWTQQLFERSRQVQALRMAALKGIQQETNRIIAEFIDSSLSVAFTYCPKRETGDYQTCEAFLQGHPTLLAEEQRVRYCLFGAHLDDITITFNTKKSRIYASRGQQKLIVALIKMAQMSELIRKKGQAIFLFDDFMTDFDEATLEKLLAVALSLGTQLIFTSPVQTGILAAMLENKGAHKIKLPY